MSQRRTEEGRREGRKVEGRIIAVRAAVPAV